MSEFAVGAWTLFAFAFGYMVATFNGRRHD